MLPPLLANIVFQAYGTSSFTNKLVTILLILLSIYTWSMMVGKGGELGIIKTNNRKFLRQYRGSAHPAKLFAAKTKFLPGIPMVCIYNAVMKELMNSLRRAGVSEEDILAWQPGAMGVCLSDTEIASVKAAAERELSEQILFIERRMSMLATCTTTAPSLGLFGTVWGVMESFMTMAHGGGNAMIANVAPGISGALLTTVLGLMIAIPSAIGYNVLNDKVRAVTVDIENFADELTSDIARVHGAAGMGGI